MKRLRFLWQWKRQVLLINVDVLVVVTVVLQRSIIGCTRLPWCRNIEFGDTSDFAILVNAAFGLLKSWISKIVDQGLQEAQVSPQICWRRARGFVARSRL